METKLLILKALVAACEFCADVDEATMGRGIGPNGSCMGCPITEAQAQVAIGDNP